MSHESPVALSHDWITPEYVVKDLGVFDLDPCQSINQPWAIAKRGFTENEDGLQRFWLGRVWLNPPYGKYARQWLSRMAAHNNGIAFIFARTGTRMFFESVWGVATAVKFLEGRVFFNRPDGSRATHSAPAPSVLVAYGKKNAEILEASAVKGKTVLL